LSPTELPAQPLISIIVPVLDEAAGIEAVLAHLAEMPGEFEVIVCDGESRDGTAELAAAHPSSPVVLLGSRGRADQQNAGAAVAQGEVMVFLHADSRLPGGAISAVREALRDPRCPGGNFALRFDSADRFSRGLTRWYAIQRRHGVYYGDSTLWMRRSTWDALGGFRAMPLMEDYELVRRLERRGRTACLPGPALTSSRRWLAAGVLRTVMTWVCIRWLWVAGIAPGRLERLYRQVR